jgi:uncharacterized membrane protein YhaH (DUF805 family)
MHLAQMEPYQPNGASPKSLTSRNTNTIFTMNWYLHALRNYANFSGRARRQEFWMFVLFNILFTVGAMVLDNALGIADPMTMYGPIYLLYALAVFVPGLAVSVRRLHDVGRSGWFLFIALLPIIGWIWLLVLYLTEGQPMLNKWGANPKNAAVMA